jgi:hypothetical protein
VRFRSFLLAVLIALGSLHVAEASDPRLTKRKVQPSGKYKSSKSKAPKAKKFKARKQKWGKYKPTR